MRDRSGPRVKLLVPQGVIVMLVQPRPVRSLPPHGAIALAGFVACQALFTVFFALWTNGESGFFRSRVSLVMKVVGAVPGVVGVFEILVVLAILAGVRRAITAAAWVEAIAALVCAAALVVDRHEWVLGLGLAATHAVTALLFWLIARRARWAVVPATRWRIAALGLEVIVAGCLIAAGAMVWLNVVGGPGPDRPPGIGLSAAARLPREPFSITLPSTTGGSRPAWQPGPRLTVVNFWATWCVPCVKELPALASVAASHDASEISVVLIETSSADPEVVSRVLATRAPAVTCLLDGGRHVWPDVARALGRDAIPTTVLLDAEGRPVARWQGGRSAAEMEHEIALALVQGHGSGLEK